MLDLAELVVINKFDKQGAADALRDVRKQWRRNRVAFDLAEDEVPVYPTIASQFADPGVTWMFANLCRALAEQAGGEARALRDPSLEPAEHEPLGNTLIPGKRVRYLAEIAEQGRGINAKVEELAAIAAKAQHLHEALKVDRQRGAAARLRGSPARARPRGDRPARRLGRADRGDHRRDLQLRGPRQGDHRPELPRVAEPPADPEDRAAPARRLGRPPALPDEGEPARLLPLHRRRLPLPARGRGPDPDVRRRGLAGAHQPPLPLPLAGAAGGAALDRLRLGHPLRRGPGRAARHLRQGRQLGRLDRHPRRRQEALLGLRPLPADDLGLDDDQRPGADHPRLLHERRGRPAGRKAPEGERPLGGDRTASSTRSSATARGPTTKASCRRATTASASACSASPAPTCSTPRPTSGSRPRPCARSAAPSRPTSSRRTRRRTPASSRPSSR